MRKTIVNGSAAVAVLALASASYAPAAEAIKVGVDTPLSGSYAPIGKQARWGAELAVEEINDASGLAPRVVTESFESLARMRGDGIALLLVKQNIRQASAISSSCYVMIKSRIIKHGASVDVLKYEEIRQKLSV